MVGLSDANRLRAKRKELSDQLDAIDRALAALSGPDSPSTTTEILPTKIKPPRTQSDDHRHAAKEGRRKARHAKEAAAGRARELLAPRRRLAPASGSDGHHPRLVKHTRSEEISDDGNHSNDPNR